MGIQQSREDSEPTLKILRSISKHTYFQAKAKLENFSRNKCKMCVTKWELLLILQLNAKQVKAIGQFISGELDPTEIDINSLLFLIVATQQEMDLTEQLFEITRFIIFDTGISDTDGKSCPAYMTFDEYRYIFQIGYHFLQRISDLDLIMHPQVFDDQDKPLYGCETEQKMIPEISLNIEDQCLVSMAVQKFAKNEEIKSYFSIFKTGNAQNTIDVQAETQNSPELIKSEKEAVDSVKADAKATGRKNNSKLTKDKKKVANFTQSNDSENGDIKIGGDQAGKNLNSGQMSGTNKMKQTNNSGGMGGVQQSQMTNSTVFTNITGSSVVEGQVGTQDGTQMPQIQQKSPHSLELMSKHILKMRNQNMDDIILNEQTQTMDKMETNLALMLSKNLELYSSRQIQQFMRTYNSQKASQELHHDQGSRALQKLINDVTANKGPEQAILQVKKQLRNTLDEYLQQSYSQLKYENATSRAQLIHFYAEGSSRGMKRTLEKKKFKLLGQIQTLRSMYSSFVESNKNMALFQNDNMFSQIFLKIQDLYNSNITQKFLLDFISLKNQKRDSKRFIDFMDGAKNQIDYINKNDFLNYRSHIVGIPSIYADAKNMIDSKFQYLTKVAHEQLIQKYQFNKIQICNYNINLGKLKAYHFMMSLIEKSPERIIEELTERIETLRVKLEKVDTDIISLLQNQQIKQKILKQYFSSMGQLAIIKCGRKGLDFNRIFDYYSLAVIKQRTYETLWLLIDIKNTQQKVKDESSPTEKGTSIPKITGEMLGTLIKLQKIKYIDKKLFEATVEDVDSQESGMSPFEKFTCFIDQQKTMCLKQSQNFSTCNNLDLKPTAKTAQFTNPDYINTCARNNLKGIYSLIGCQEQYKQLNSYAGSKDNKKQVFQLDYSHMKVSKENTKIQNSYKAMLKEFDQYDNFIHEFVPFITDQEKNQELPCDPEEKDKEMIAHIKCISTSFININFEEQRKAQYKEKKLAYKNVETFLASLIQFDDKTYEQNFKQQRDIVFKEAIEILFSINKKGFLNGFNMKFLSLSIEHSMLNNYWSYQIIKCFLKEQMKAKIVADVSLIASINDINSPVLTQSAVNMQEINLSPGNEIINITHRQSSSGPSATQVKAHSTGKLDKIYGSLFQILNNTDNFDRRGKQSLFKGLLQQMDSQMNVYEIQIKIFQEILNEFKEHDKDMFRISNTVTGIIDANTNEKTLTDLFGQYERANANFCNIQNQKNIDNIFQGAMKYLSSLRDVLNKESNDDGSGKGGGKNITEFINKINNDISQVNTKLNAKFKRAQDEIQKQKDEAAAAEKKKLGKSPDKRSSSPSKVPTSPGNSKSVAKDPVKSELKDTENKIIEQVITAFTYQEIVIAIRMYDDPDEFAYQITQKMTNINSYKKDRLKTMKNYLNAVTYLWDKYNNSSSNLEVQEAQENISQGASLINAVLSGNIFNQIDIYANSKDKEGGALVTQQTQQTQMGEASPIPHQDLLQDSREENIDINEEGEDSPLSKATIATTAAKKEQQIKEQLSQNQRGLNYFINFLNQICLQEDKLSSKRILQKSNLFQFSNQAWVHFQESKMMMTQYRNIEHALSNLINIYEIQSTPIQKYLQTYEIQSEYVKKNLFQMLTQSNQQLLEAQFFMIIQKHSKHQSELNKNKIDDVFHEATLEDDEKQEFLTATTKTRRNLDQELRTYIEFLDSQANKKLDQVHLGALQQKEKKFSHSVSALGLLVRIYYLKQIQQQEDFQFCLEFKQKKQLMAQKAVSEDGQVILEEGDMN